MAALAAPPMDAGSLGGGDFDSELSSALMSGVEAEASETPGGEGADTPMNFPVTEDVPGGESPTDPQDAAQQDQEAAPTGNDPFPLSPDGKGYIVPKEELTNFTGLKQYAQEIQSKFPTVADAQIAYQRSSDHRAMEQDYLSGNPQSIEEVLGYWAGKYSTTPELRNDMQQSFVKMAERMPDMLAQINPQAHQQFTTAVVSKQIESAYSKAAQSGDPNDLLKAQYIDWAVTGQYKESAPKVDPNAGKVDPTQARAQQLDQREQTQFTRDFSNFNRAQMDGVKWNSLNAEIDKTLGATKEGLEKAYGPAMVQAGQKLVKEKVLEKLQADHEWSRTHINERVALENSFKKGWQTSNGQYDGKSIAPQVQSYINDFMIRARQHLPSIVKEVFQPAQGIKPTANGTPRPQQRQAQPRPQQTPNGSPQQQPQQGKSRADEFDDILNGVFAPFKK